MRNVGNTEISTQKNDGHGQIQPRKGSSVREQDFEQRKYRVQSVFADVRVRYIVERQIRFSRWIPDRISPLNGVSKESEDARRAQYTIVTMIARRHVRFLIITERSD